MLRGHPVLASLLLGLASVACAVAQGASPARAVEPDDTPWSVNDADPGKQPSSIDELLARDRQTITEDHDIAPPGQDQPDPVRHPASDQVEEDRLNPYVAPELHNARENRQQTTIPPVGAPPVAGERRMDPAMAAPAQSPRPDSAAPHVAQPAQAVPETIAPVAAPRSPVTPAAAAKTAVAPATPGNAAINGARAPETLPQVPVPAALPPAAPVPQSVVT
ncbi:MAG: hypothetical protein ABL907_03370, partial [Hyphomicrobium sp.]